MSGNAVRKEEAAEVVVAVLPKQEPGEVSPKEKEMGSEVSEIELRARAIVIQSDDDYQAAGEFGVQIKKAAGEVVDFFKPMKDAAYQAHKAICDREKAMLAPLKAAEQALKQTMGDYSMEQERKRREAEEAVRKAAEEEARRKLEEAAAMEKEGKTGEAEAALTEAEIMETAGRAVFVPSSVPKAKGVSASSDWEITGIDPKAVPLSINGAELRPVDKAAVMRLIRASKGTIQIPGITYRETRKLSFSKK